MLPLIPLIIGAALLGGAIGAIVVTAIVFWPEIREKIINYLHRNGINSGALVAAFIIIDKVMSRVRAFVKKRNSTTATVTERKLTQDEMNDLPEEVKEELRKKGSSKIDVLEDIG